MRSLRNLPTNRRIPGIFRNWRGFKGRGAVPAFGCITPLPNCPNAFSCEYPHIPNGILCRPGDFFFRIIAGGIRLLRLPVRRLFRFAPDKVSLHLLLSGIHYRLLLPLPCLDFRQWPRLRSGLTGKPSLTGAGGHKLVELGIFRKTVDERNEGTAILNKA